MDEAYRRGFRRPLAEGVAHAIREDGGRTPAARDMKAATRPFGFNLIGHVTANMGLGVAARSVARLIVERGQPLAAFDVDAGVGRNGADQTYRAQLVDSTGALPYSINLFVLGANRLRSFLAEHAELSSSDEALNAAVAFWELPTLPPRWLPTLDALDVVVATSEFIRYSHQFSLSGPIVLSGRIPSEMPAGVAADRAAFGLADDTVAFVTSFEPQSDPARKNVAAAIEAFGSAFTGDEDAVLIVKVNNARDAGGNEHPVVSTLRAQSGDPRVRLLTQPLDYREVLSLYASCDVYVSMHRAEGLGLGLAEAMVLGKPVVATGWSGNLTFMDQLNSCLLGYRLVPVKGTTVFYNDAELEENTCWAEPSVGEAAAWMKRLFEDPELRRSIGHRAAASMSAYNADAREAHFLREISAIFANGLFRLDGGLRHRGGEAEAMRTSRLARIQELERELDWITSRPSFRLAQSVKQLIKFSVGSRDAGRDGR